MWKSAPERGPRQREAEEAGHRRYAKAWELHQLGVSVMSASGGPDPALTEEVLDRMLAAEKGRRARLYDTFARAGNVTIFPALGVQMIAGDDAVYTIGNHDPLTETNSSRSLGLLHRAEAVVTDDLPGSNPGDAMFLPLAPAALATKTVADAAVIFSDGTVHTRALNGNSEVREAQKQVERFNALAAGSAPETAGTDNETDREHAARLHKLQELRKAGLLSQEENDAKRTEIIKSI